MVIKFEISLIFILFFCFEFSESSQLLWCQQGGEKKNWGPIQCPEKTKECFKFDCIGGQDTFTARGCGISTLSKGLRNESCFQAMEACQFLGGEPLCNVCNNKHMCNSSNFNSVSLFSLTIFYIIIIYIFR